MSQESVYRKIRPRIESLSDLVFGLALSIGSLTLIGTIPKDVVSLELGVLYFAFSFIIVIMTWSGYTRTVVYLPIENESTFFLNVGLLFVVALEPFLFYVLVSTPTSSLSFADAASTAYALDVGSMFLILAAFAWMVSVQEKRRADPNPLVMRYRRITVILVFGAGLFLLSALPFFWFPFAGSFFRIYLWYPSLATFFATRAVVRTRRKSSELRKENV